MSSPYKYLMSTCTALCDLKLFEKHLNIALMTINCTHDLYPITNVYVKNGRFWITSTMFFFLCKPLTILISKYISPYFLTEPSMNEFVDLLSWEHSKSRNNLAIFVYFGLMTYCKFMEKTWFSPRNNKMIFTLGLAIILDHLQANTS